MYRRSKNNLLNSNISSTRSHNMGNLGPLVAEICSGVWAPIKFQRVSRVGSVTAWLSSSRHQPNFAVLNTGRHLYSAGQPSRWALTHILVPIILGMAFATACANDRSCDKCVKTVQTLFQFLTGFYKITIEIKLLVFLAADNCMFITFQVLHCKR